MSRRRRDEPVPLGESLRAITDDLGMGRPTDVEALRSAWPEIVGAPLAAHTEVRSLRDGVCTVGVDGTAWATQMRYLEAAVVEHAATHCGPGVVRALRVVVKAPGTTDS